MDEHSRFAERRTFFARCQREFRCDEFTQTQSVRFIRMLCFASICLIPFANSAGQQSPSGTTNSTTQSVPPVSGSNTEAWKKSRPLSNRKPSFEDLLKAEKVAVLEIQQPSLVPTPPRHRVADDMEHRQRENEASFRDLRERIILLQKRLQLQKSAADAEPTQEPSKTVPEPPVITPVISDPAPDPGSSSGAGLTDDGHVVTSPLSVPPPPDAAVPPPPAVIDSVFADSMNAKAIVEGPVDRIGLADSLYALKELPIALEMYEKVDVKHVAPSERYWVSFQRACCLRKLKRIPEAQELYRRLAGQQNAGWLAEVSRWWLDQIDARMELETHLSEYDAILTALKESSDDRNRQ